MEKDNKSLSDQFEMTKSINKSVEDLSFLLCEAIELNIDLIMENNHVVGKDQEETLQYMDVIIGFSINALTYSFLKNAFEESEVESACKFLHKNLLRSIRDETE